MIGNLLIPATGSFVTPMDDNFFQLVSERRLLIFSHPITEASIEKVSDEEREKEKSHGWMNYQAYGHLRAAYYSSDDLYKLNWSKVDPPIYKSVADTTLYSSGGIYGHILVITSTFSSSVG